MTSHKQNWLDVFAGFRIAFDARKIILGTVGMLISTLVLLGLLHLAGSWYPRAREAGAVLLRDPLIYLRLFSDEMRQADTLFEKRLLLANTARNVRTFIVNLDGRSIALFSAGAVILLFIWSYIGGAMARLAAVDFAREERLPVGDATTFSARKFGSFFWCPIVPLIFAVILIFCMMFLGWLGRIPAVGPIVMGVGYPLAAIAASFTLLLFIGTVLGFPFMWPTIAMEGTDAFDAISRAFSYLFSHPWKTLWCWFMASVYGIVVVGFVAWFTGALLRLTDAVVARGMGADWVWIEQFLRDGIADRAAGFPLLIAMVLITVVHVLAWGLVFGFIASYKISAMTIIYAVLRRAADGADMSEVYLPEAESPLPVEPSFPSQSDESDSDEGPNPSE
jgi:hypothetical protein